METFYLISAPDSLADSDSLLPEISELTAWLSLNRYEMQKNPWRCRTKFLGARFGAGYSGPRQGESDCAFALVGDDVAPPKVHGDCRPNRDRLFRHDHFRYKNGRLGRLGKVFRVHRRHLRSTQVEKAIAENMNYRKLKFAHD